MAIGAHNEEYGLEKHGIENYGNVYWTCPPPVLYEEAIRRREGTISYRGPLVVRTGEYTGRSPNDRFLVEESTTKDEINWGSTNRSISPDKFDALFLRLQAYLQGKDIFVQDCYAGTDEENRISVRVITEDAWHSLFARNMFVRINNDDELRSFVPGFTVINAPGFHATPGYDGTRSEAFVIANFEKKLVIIGGTSYAGEIKKSIFSVLNFILPGKGVLSMHCSANNGKDGDCALFFGLSGTGKTTLSADPNRRLIGDDEHGWSDNGIFNFEGGCYAKVINLSKEAEPEIYECTRRFGTILENVQIDHRWRRLDLDDKSLTENTRAAYPIAFIPNFEESGKGNHPKNIIFLTADAFGVMPPISKLTTEQAMYHFISGYTAKVAGTERGIVEPQATFSACFGAAFMIRSPIVYAKLLGEKIRKHEVNCWLVNTGWTGGAYGVGHRISIKHTRTLLNDALEGKLNNVPTIQDPVFGLAYPSECPGIPTEILNPRNSWDDKEAYDIKAKELAELFKTNFKQYEKDVDPSIAKGGPIA
ncbi:MAG: phosphoenolpyruvate carboxykinase [Nitrospinae bacterium]|nr:phosphoenolpyruvate carboxykinase [Nitrospinota bacterium]